MDMQFFDDPNVVPQPKDKIKIESLNVTPYPDRFRVFIDIKVTPFQIRPNLILVARTHDGKIVGELNIIERCTRIWNSPSIFAVLMTPQVTTH